MPFRTSLKMLVAAAALALTTGCVTTPNVILHDEGAARLDALLEGVTTGAPADTTLHLSDEVLTVLDERIDPSWSQNKRLRELRSFLFSEGGLDITYDAEETKTASETFTSKTGNCLSLSNLFVASARHIGLDSRFQLVSIRPTWDHQGSTMIRYEHIVAYGEINTRDEYVIDFLPEFSTSDSEVETIDDVTALAHYYNNLGAEGVVNGQYDSAIENILRAASLKPDYSDAWNNLGAAFRRKGESELAELSYKRALAINRNNYSALGNLTQFYISEDRGHEAAQFVRRANRYYERNPYFHYYLAQLHYHAHEFGEARDFLNAAVRLKRDDPNFYDALADVNTRLGYRTEAREAEILAERVREKRARERGVTDRATRVRWTQTIQW